MVRQKDAGHTKIEADQDIFAAEANHWIANSLQMASITLRRADRDPDQRIMLAASQFEVLADLHRRMMDAGFGDADIDLAAAVGGFVERMRRVAEIQSREIAPFAAKPVTIKARRARIALMALGEMLLNAIKHGLPDDTVSVALTEHDGNCILTVSNAVANNAHSGGYEILTRLAQLVDGVFRATLAPGRFSGAFMFPNSESASLASVRPVSAPAGGVLAK